MPGSATVSDERPAADGVPRARVVVVGDVGHPWSHTLLLARCLNGLTAEGAQALCRLSAPLHSGVRSARTASLSGWERQGYDAAWSIEAYGEYGEVLATLQPAALHATQRAPAPQRPCTIRQGWASAAVDLFTADGRAVRERLR